MPVIVVYKKSKLDLYVNEKKNARVAALLQAGAEVTRQFEGAHDAHQDALDTVSRVLERLKVKFRTVYRAGLRAEATRGHLVVTVGGDGTLLDASRKVRDATVLGVNSDPERSVGFLCAATQTDFEDVFRAAIEGALAPTEVARLALRLDGELVGHPALNDVLIAHKNPAATTHYLLDAKGARESHKSSGIWIAAPAGSTAAILSAGGQVLALDDGQMQLRVREPFGLDKKKPALTSLFVDRQDAVRITSKMREGRIFLDGAHHRIAFPIGAELTIAPTAPALKLVVTDAMRQRRLQLANEQQSQR